MCHQLASTSVFYLTEPTSIAQLHIDDATATTVHLSWKIPKNPKGVIIKYEVRYHRTENGRSKIVRRINTQGFYVSSFNLIGLVGDTEYQFRVRAFTRVGAGPWSNLVIGRTGE